MNAVPHTPKILIVDDEEQVATLLSKRLRLIGYDASACLNAREMWEMLPKTKPQLILLDIQLPDVNGFQIYNDLQAHPKHRDIPVIFITAQSHYREQCATELNAKGFFVKPYDAHELFEAIRLALLPKKEENNAAEA